LSSHLGFLREITGASLPYHRNCNDKEKGKCKDEFPSSEFLRTKENILIGFALENKQIT
jgi:hypothetical protein